MFIRNTCSWLLSYRMYDICMLYRYIYMVFMLGDPIEYIVLCTVSMQNIWRPRMVSILTIWSIHGAHTEYMVPMHGVHEEYHCANAWCPSRISLCLYMVSIQNIIVPMYGVYTEIIVSMHSVHAEYHCANAWCQYRICVVYSIQIDVQARGPYRI